MIGKGFQAISLWAVLYSFALHLSQAQSIAPKPIAAGGFQSLVVRSDGLVWGFGDNQHGQLGNGTEDEALLPTPLINVSNILAVSTCSLDEAARRGHSLALKADGTVWSFGRNSNGQLGLGNFVDSDEPLQISTLDNIISVSAGALHSLALDSSGSIWAFGRNLYGEVGDGTHDNNRSNPVQVVDLTNAVAIAAGLNSSLAADATGQVWAFGLNENDQLGWGSLPGFSNVPRSVPGLSNIVAVSTSGLHSLALDSSGDVWAFGGNSQGQLGNGTNTSSITPIKVSGLSDVVAIAAGGSPRPVSNKRGYSLALKSDGTVWGFGDNANGQLGLGNTSSTNVAVQLPVGTNIIAISAGLYHSMLLTRYGDLVVFGTNEFGQLGIDVVSALTTPTPNYDFKFTRQWEFAYHSIIFQAEGLWHAGRDTPPSRYASDTNAYFYFSDYDVNTELGILYGAYLHGLDRQKGVWMSQTMANFYSTNHPWTNTIYRYTPSNLGELDASDLPWTAFGRRVGGSALYLNQPYRFEVFMGIPWTNSTPSTFSIGVYQKSDMSVVTNIQITLPAQGDTVAYQEFADHGITVEAHGLTTLIEHFRDMPLDSYREHSFFPYLVTHTCTSTNYVYDFGASGYVEFPTQENPFNRAAVYSHSQSDVLDAAIAKLYVMEFEPRPAWSYEFIEQPHFEYRPLPSTYLGKSTMELLATAPTLPTISITNESEYLELDHSPELRRHSILIDFVNDMKSDPVALANFVFNEIELTDAGSEYATGVGSARDLTAIGGLNRSALGTYLEGQGSPLEQCALLVYLLREAGVPAAYVFPTNSGVRLLPEQVNRLLGIKFGDSESTNTIVVNYPWVAAWVEDEVNPSGRWVQIFPWLKDVDLVEGLNLYEHLPVDYNSGYKWVTRYMGGDTNILSLDAESNEPQALLPKFITQSLADRFPGVSLDDLGIRYLNRRVLRSRWDDFPKPFTVGEDIETLESLKIISNIFNRVKVLLSGVGGKVDVVNPICFASTPSAYSVELNIGEFLTCDLINRKLLITSEELPESNYVINWEVAARLGSMEWDNNATNLFPWTGDLSEGANAFFARTNVFKRLRWYDSIDNPCFSFVRYTYGYDLFFQTTYDNAAPTAVVGSPEQWAATITRSTTTTTATIANGTTTAFCLNVGKVSKRMLDVHAQEIWRYEQDLLEGAATNTVISHGTALYLMGMSYWENVSRFFDMNERLHKTRAATRQGHLFTSLVGGVDNSFNPPQSAVIPRMDVAYYSERFALNYDFPIAPEYFLPNGYRIVNTAQMSAAEHAVMNRFLNITNATSTMRLLQLAGTNAVHLTRANWKALADTDYGGTPLNEHDTNMWAFVESFFALNYYNPYNIHVFLTPGEMSNGGFTGMGGLLVQDFYFSALISGSSLLNGGLGYMPYNAFNDYRLSSDREAYWMDRLFGSPNVKMYPGVTRWDQSQAMWNQISSDQFLMSDADLAFWGMRRTWGGLPTPSHASLYRYNLDYGALDTTTSWNKSQGSWVSDPVNAVTGGFYIDQVDLSLEGPMPLVMRRNYSSHNLALNQLGHGWKLNCMPFLEIATNNNVIYAAEMDGSVIAYSPVDTDIWAPVLTNNPALNNNATEGKGGLANMFHARITLADGTNYVLSGPDGSQRHFSVRSYPVIGTNGLFVERSRPYLDTWTDDRGNAYAFTMGSDSNSPAYGQLRRIDSSNGNYLNFDYDAYGRIVAAYCGDGRRVEYDYDVYGDLQSVTLPDGNSIHYEYEHLTALVTNLVSGTNQITEANYSTHLLTRENKPDGRVLANWYDDLRRVVVQAATVGPDLQLVTNATFQYANNFSLTNALTNSVTGYTLITDVNDNELRYDYVSGLITKIDDPINPVIEQYWYPDDATEPGYPRSLWYTKDRRGLMTTNLYDAYGNLTQVIRGGDLTGHGTGNQVSVSSYTYDTNNHTLFTSTDPAGNTTEFRYHAQYPYVPEEIVYYAGATAIRTNRLEYDNVTNVVTHGTSTFTNIALGLLTREIRAFGSANAATNQWEYDGRGFVTTHTRHTGTGDPAVAVDYFYDGRNQLIEQTDAAGRQTRYDYDGLGRLKYKEVLESGQSVPLSGEYSYYNANGELVWSDGPRYDPEDYVWRDYDGAGRMIAELKWRSGAQLDGSGVGALAENALYDTTTFDYDAFGNLIRVTDANGHYSQMDYDAIGQMVGQSFYDASDTLLSTRLLAYEPGGEVAYETNALGGVTEKQYTSLGQIKFQRNPDDSTQSWRYDVSGRETTNTLSNGSYWRTDYDDANRRVTRTFYSASDVALATNVAYSDLRGNVIVEVDAAGFASTNAYDGLDRVKWTAGPAITNAIVEVQPAPPPPPVQHVVTNYYDAAGLVVTNVNALGEKTITYSDALGRVTRKEIRNATNSLVREVTTDYADNHLSMTVTEGSGAGALVTTTYTDNQGREVARNAVPASGVRQFLVKGYDRVGNLLFGFDGSDSNGTLVAWSAYFNAYDGLNRLIQRDDRDGALTTFYYDAAGNLTNRVMPGGLSWHAAYNSANQVTEDYNLGTGSEGARTNTYTYYGSASPHVGLLATRTDNRGVTCTYTYDAWLRAATNTHSGPLDEHDLETVWTYDARGLLTSLSERFDDPATGPDTKVSRAYDAYGLLQSESVSIDGEVHTTALQNWDSAGRRNSLRLGNFVFRYGWDADGLLASVLGDTGGGIYTYDTAGQLTGRYVGAKTVTIDGRDGMGRPLSRTNTLGGQSVLGEALGWTGDGLLATHTLTTTNYSDSRAYQYANASRRLLQEELHLDASTTWTNGFVYDQGVTQGPGVLTQNGSAAESALWNGGTDGLSRIASETNTFHRALAWGTNNGVARIAAFLNGRPVPVTQYEPLKWQAQLDLTPGTHVLAVTAHHPSGLFTVGATNWFTNSIASQRIEAAYDAHGQLTQRVWKNASSQVVRTQSYSWDAQGRLRLVTDRDDGNDGYDWRAIYDGLGRRLKTITQIVVDGTASTNQPVYISQFYDPQVEFLEVGVDQDGWTTWKLYGPDDGGTYGAMSGLGGLDAIIPGAELFCPVISDAQGNLHAVYDQGHSTLHYYSSRVSAYGAVPGYRPVAFGAGTMVDQASAWRGRWGDITGLYCLGTRYYDPISGRFLTADPLGHESDPSLYAAFGGDPINYFDPDGRFARGVYNGVGSFGSELSASAAIALDALFKPIVGLFDPFAAQMHFSGGYKPNPAFANAYYSGSDAFRAGHQVGYFGAELGTSAALGYGLGRVLAPPLGGVGYAMGISSRPFWGGLGFADDAFAATRTGSAGLFGDAFGMGATRTGSAFGYEWGASRTFSAGGTAFGTDLRTSWGFFDDTLTGSSGGSRFLGNPAKANPNPLTGLGYGVTDPPVRIQGSWTEVDFKTALQGRPPPSLGRPDLHHAGQMPGSAIHEVLPNLHRGNTALHPNKFNQGVTPLMRAQDRQLHWWYRAREQGADSLFPDLIYDY